MPRTPPPSPTSRLDIPLALVRRLFRIGASANDLELVEAHRLILLAKPLLRACYARYHELILGRCPRDARVVELGCGAGLFAQTARARGYAHWLATDLIASSERLRCDAALLPFRAASVDRIVFVDVLHHLAAPLAFFAEAARTLRPGGEIVGVEPWVTPLSFAIYRFLHHEGCDLSRDPLAPFAKEGSKPAYLGDAAIPMLLCRDVPAPRWHALGLEPPQTRTFNDFAYLATGGLSDVPEAPALVHHALRLGLDDLLSGAAPVLGIRSLITWRRLDAPVRPA